jgi:oligopeptide/dipeptide ABC transporter ATP-binding protein
VTAPSSPVLSVRDLTCQIEKHDGTARILKGVSLDVQQGETVGLVGESGSGKTMLVKSIMGISPARAQVSGTAVLNGVDILSAPIAQRREIWGKQIAMVFQDPMSSLNPVVRVGRQITEGMRRHLHISQDEANERAIELLKLVGIGDAKARLRMYPHQLSGGMRQRIMIAIALSCDPDLLITDEATTALDVTVQKQILNLLQRLQADRGMSIIMVSHDLGVVASRTDRVAVMYAGRIVEMSPTGDLFANTRHRYTEALLGAIPRVDKPGSGLTSIPGSMPSTLALSNACDFAPRCRFAVEACFTERPPRASEGDGHQFECFVPVGTEVRVREEVVR